MTDEGEIADLLNQIATLMGDGLKQRAAEHRELIEKLDGMEAMLHIIESSLDN